MPRSAAKRVSSTAHLPRSPVEYDKHTSPLPPPPSNNHHATVIDVNDDNDNDNNTDNDTNDNDNDDNDKHFSDEYSNESDHNQPAPPPPKNSKRCATTALSNDEDSDQTSKQNSTQKKASTKKKKKQKLQGTLLYSTIIYCLCFSVESDVDDNGMDRDVKLQHIDDDQPSRKLSKTADIDHFYQRGIKIPRDKKTRAKCLSCL